METLHRPIPRRPYDLPEDISPEPSTSSLKPSKSALALNASTLFGIYSTYNDESSAPTPALSRSTSSAALHPIRPLRTREEEAAAAFTRAHPPKRSPAWLVFRGLALWVFGVAYGALVTHLDERNPITPSTREKKGLVGLVLWGFAGVVGGTVLPWVDGILGREEGEGVGEVEEGDEKDKRMGWGGVVRSVGAFVGIAFAIRKLPWTSTLQLSLALALVNPFLWYLIDRTRAGFWFSTLIAMVGTVVLVGAPGVVTLPEMVSMPLLREMAVRGESEERAAVMTWISSVLFCSCVCFGNVGRKLSRKEGLGAI